MDRIAEWETLKIVECLLLHIHSAVDDSVETGAPCPTIDSDPEGVNMTISDCHVVTRGCAFAWNHTFDRGDAFQAVGEGFDRGNGISGSGAVYSDDLVQHSDADGNIGTWPINADSLTAHLCLSWCPIPPVPAQPPVLPAACTPEFVAMEQGSFVGSIQTEFEAAILADTAYPQYPLGNFLTGLSDAGWAGCAAPLLCVDCSGLAADEPVYSETLAHECHVSEQYLLAGQSDTSTFRCQDGTCLPMAGRCNGYAQCGDASDEQGCDTAYGTPAYLGVAESCPADFNADVHHRCANSLCIEKVGLCNGHDNCGDGSDEAQCTGAFTVDVEATSGRQITVEHLQSHTKAFHDREYDFESLGSFSGKTFIKYSNDDKLTDHEHVMTKIRTSAPMTVFVVKMATDSLPWLIGQNYQLTSLSGVSFKGQRVINRGVAATEWEDTRHKEWDHTLNTEDSYTLSQVYSKTFPAGTISIPGNDGGDGSFLIFVDRPSTAVAAPTSEEQYIGCFVDDASRDLGAMEPGGAVYTYATCLARCGDHNFMSLQWGGECFCADAYATQTQYRQVEDSLCNVVREPCTSSSTHNCGGTWHQAIYQVGCPHLHNQDVVAGTFAHYGADHGDSASDAACSASCTASAECTAWVRQPSTGRCWLSSQAEVTFEADSDRTTGLRCN